jgi:hypothetical protein
MAETQKPDTIVNQPEMDGKVKRDTDLGKQMEHETNEAREAQLEVKRLERIAAEIMDGWTEEGKDGLKASSEVSKRYNPHVIPDPTVVPEFLELRGGGKRRIRHDDEFVYRWVRTLGENPRVPWRRTQGYRHMFYDEYCKDTVCDWERFGAEGYILNGDCVLMRIPRRKHAELTRRKEALDELFDRKVTEDFDEAIKEVGGQPFREIEGKKHFT